LLVCPITTAKAMKLLNPKKVEERG
jgi:hypothetical protein